MTNQSDQQLVSKKASTESIQSAINTLLNELSPLLTKKSESLSTDPLSRIACCIELVKTEASLAASLIADCAPQGRPMLAQAQQTLKTLESLQILAKAAINSH